MILKFNKHLSLFFIFIFSWFYAQETKKDTVLINRLIKEGLEFSDKSDFNLGIDKLNQALNLDPNNEGAIIGLMISYEEGEMFHELAKFSKYELIFKGSEYANRYLFIMAISSIYEDKEDKFNYYFKIYNQSLNGLVLDDLGRAKLLSLDYFSLAKVNYRKKRFDKALYWLDLFFEKYPNQESKLTNNSIYRFYILYEMGKKEEAISKLLKCQGDTNKDAIEKEMEISLNLYKYLEFHGDCKTINSLSKIIFQNKYSSVLTEKESANLKFKANSCGYFDEERLNIIRKIDYNLLDKSNKLLYAEISLTHYILENDCDAFLKSIELVKKDFPDNFYLEAMHGLCYLSLGQKQKAEEHLLKSLTKTDSNSKYPPFNVLINTFTAHFYSLYSNGDEVIKKIRGTEGIQAKYLYGIGARTEDINLLNALFDLGVEISKTSEDKAKFRVLQSLKNVNADFSKTFSLIEDAYNLNPLDYYKLIKMFYNTFYYIENEIDYDEILEIKKLSESITDAPNMFFVEYMMSFAYFHLGELDKACELIKKLKTADLVDDKDVFCKKEYSMQSQIQTGIGILNPSLLVENVFP